MRNILVTGGAGFIGSLTSKELIRSGFITIIFDNFFYSNKNILKKLLNAKFIKGDINDQDLLIKTLNDFSIDAVIHFAAFTDVRESNLNPIKYYKNNLIGSIKLIEAIIKNKSNNKDLKPIPILFSSSCSVYGIPKKIPIKENILRSPINSYGNTKFFIEKILEDYGKAYDLRSISFRYFNAAGASTDGIIGDFKNPGEHLIPLAFDSISSSQKTLVVYGNDYNTPDGTCIRDFIHVEDLANAHIIGLKKIFNVKNTYTEFYNLASGKGYSVLEIINCIQRITNRKVNYIFGKKREGDPPILIADASKAKRELGWEAKNSQLEKIIKDAWNWYKKINFVNQI